MMATKRNRGKITLFIGSLTGGGAERVICNLANYLYDKDYKVDVITMSDVPDTYIVNEGVGRVHLLRKEERSNSIRDYFLRRKRLKEYMVKNSDISCYIVMLPITIFMLMRLKKYTNSKIIISERCNPMSYNLIKKLIMKYSARRCDGLVVQTKDINKWYKGVKNKVIIPNAVNKDIVLPDRKNIEKKIVAVGRLEKQKNYPMLIKAFRIFHEREPDYTLEIYGKGSEEKYLKEMVDKFGLNENVLFKGYVDNVSRYMVSAACFVMTSDFEGMPNALIEAMCIGVPCIATDCGGGGIKELINNKNGILIKRNDVHSLVDSLIKIVSNKKLAKEISKNAILIKKNLSYNSVYGKWEQYINSIVGEK